MIRILTLVIRNINISNLTGEKIYTFPYIFSQLEFGYNIRHQHPKYINHNCQDNGDEIGKINVSYISSNYTTKSVFFYICNKKNKRFLHKL